MGTGASHSPEVGVPINPRVGYADQLARKERKHADQCHSTSGLQQAAFVFSSCAPHVTSDRSKMAASSCRKDDANQIRDCLKVPRAISQTTMWEVMRKWLCRYLMVFIVLSLPFGVLGSDAESVSVEDGGTAFKDLPIPVFQRHLRMARHLPICIVYHTAGERTALEESVVAIWETRTAAQNYSSWQLGGFPVDKYDHPPVPIPQEVPLLRCFLGQKLPFDYPGKPKKGPIKKWLNRLSVEYYEQLEEASVDLVKQITKDNELTLLGFSDFHQHHDLEELLSEIRDKYWGVVRVLFVHPHSPHIKTLQSLYNVSTLPAVIFIENSAQTRRKPAVVKVLKGVDILMSHIDVYLMARQIPAVKLNLNNFEETVLFKSRSHQPMLVCFYAWWAKNVTSYLSQFQRTIEEYGDLGIRLRFGLLEINQESQRIIGSHVNPVMAKKFPFIILFRLRMKRTTVDGIDQVLYTGERPTPWNVYQFLIDVQLPLVTSDKLPVVYEPWGFTPSTEISLASEGPHGYLCFSNSHNQTENDPAPPVVVVKRRKQFSQKVKKETSETKDRSWHDRFSSESIHSKLSRIGLLPQVTAATWAEVIETSHAPSHPLIAGSKWQGEVTKVALVIFIMADCGSCERNMNLFEELYKAVSYIEGGSAYIINCTVDALLCDKLGIRGFPTLSAFRGVGWMDGHDCVSESDEWDKHVRLDYYGVMLLKPIMSWFSDAAAAAITHVQFEELDNDEMEEDVRLVATLIPKGSRFLPKVLARVKQDSFYPYKCFRLACERLYGQAPCYVQFSSEIPQREYDSEVDQEMVVTQVELYRSDGLAALVTRLGQSLVSTMEESSDMSIHHLHRPHRYHIPPGDRCEDNHGRCTDLLVQFTRDHGRLPLSAVTASTFHSKNSLILSDELPVMVALVHAENITVNSKFYKTLLGTAHDLYSRMIIVTVDVDQYPAWVGHFVPKGYSSSGPDCVDSRCLYTFYPRLCVIWWRDHEHAAFYPPLNTDLNKPFRFMKKNIIAFAYEFLEDPDALMFETEHF